MSQILLKKVPASAITTPGSTDVKFFSNFNDNGLLYYMDSSGNPIPVGGSTYTAVIPVTYTALYSLYTGSQFATGSHYLITDYYTAYEQPDYYFDDTLKTNGMYKTSPITPLLVLAISKDKLSPYATQPNYPQDKIKYDISWNKTEFANNSRGRVTERIDSNGNRTDYDHRTVRFKRYQSYDRDAQLAGTITTYDCVSGVVTGSSTNFLSSVSVGDVIIFDSLNDIGYDIGVKVSQVVNDYTLNVQVDSLYTGGVPSPVTLYNGISLITPQNYSFTGKSYLSWKTTATGTFNSYKEVYFSQSDDDDYDTYYTFNMSQTSGTNISSNYSQNYLSGQNNFLVLANNVISHSSINNNISGYFFNNNLTSLVNNSISGDMYNNIVDDFLNNIISNSFLNNKLGSFMKNTVNDEFSFNYCSSGYGIQYNTFQYQTSGLVFSVSSTHVYGGYNCNIFANSNGDLVLSYYDDTNVLTIVSPVD